MIQWGRERARAGPWRGNEAVAYLSPVADAPAPSAAFVRRCLADLSQRGYRQVVTGALSASESGGFLAAGFEITERLYLLAYDLRTPPPVPRAAFPLRRARPHDHPEVLALDHRAFPPFWRLDTMGLDEAVHATPHARFRVSTTDGPGAAGPGDSPADLGPAPSPPAGQISGYAVWGRAARRGYLQRLAVDPEHRRLGLASLLVIDGLRWLRRWRVERAVVNTQFDNEAALELYECIGFQRQPLGLSVLSAGLPTGT